ncbi:26640_t:CDS:1, partial [Racocetra persica]
LDKEEAILVVDYKMKILPKSTRETKQEFFGKKGWILHTVLVYTYPSDSGQLQVTAYDYWSADMHQDAWFTASSLHTI